MWETMSLSTLADCTRALPGYWKFPVTFTTGKPETSRQVCFQLTAQTELSGCACSGCWELPTHMKTSLHFNRISLLVSGWPWAALSLPQCCDCRLVPPRKTHDRVISLNAINWFDFKIPYLIRVEWHICLPVSIARSPWVLGTCQPFVVNVMFPVWIFFLPFGQETVCVKACLFFNVCFG